MKYSDRQIRAAAEAWERAMPGTPLDYAEKAISYLVSEGTTPVSSGERAAMMSLAGKPLPEELRALRVAQRSPGSVPDYYERYLRTCAALGWAETLGDGVWRVTSAGQRVMRLGGEGHRFRS